VGPHTGQPRQPVFELRQLDLEAPLVGLGPFGEDIENEGRAVDDLDIECFFEIALLGRRKLVVEDDQVIPQPLTLGLDLLELALADIRAGERMAQLLSDRADDLDVDRLGQARQLLE
jgi:hypothetical protein